jgi:hypothetical protein
VDGLPTAACAASELVKTMFYPSPRNGSSCWTSKNGVRTLAPTRIGAIDIAHRVVHAPTTRLRALAKETLSPMMVDYYRQRASRGSLLVRLFR